MTSSIPSMSIYGQYNMLGLNTTTGALGFGGTTNSLTNSYMAQMFVSQNCQQEIEDVTYFLLESDDLTKAIMAYQEYVEKAGIYAAQYGLTGDVIGSDVFRQQVGRSFLSIGREQVNNSFMTGFLEGLPIAGFFAETTSEAELSAAVKNKKVKGEEKFLEQAGATCGVLVGAGSGALIGAKIGTVGGLPGVAVGAIIGGAISLVSALIKLNSNKVA